MPVKGSWVPLVGIGGPRSDGSGDIAGGQESGREGEEGGVDWEVVCKVFLQERKDSRLALQLCSFSLASSVCSPAPLSRHHARLPLPASLYRLF